MVSASVAHSLEGSSTVTNYSHGFSVEVTEEVIAVAVPRNSGHCVISEAIKRLFPEATSISTDLQTIRFSVPEERKRYIYFTPGWAQRLLVDFDKGVAPKPCVRKVGRSCQIMKMRGGKKGVTQPRRVTRPNDGNGAPPTVHGGKAPPRAALSDRTAKRREFGLRSLER